MGPRRRSPRAAAILCDRGKRLLAGLEQVDSLSFDPHKWLFQPYECGLRHIVRYPDYLDGTHRDPPMCTINPRTTPGDIRETIDLLTSCALNLWTAFGQQLC